MAKDKNGFDLNEKGDISFLPFVRGAVGSAPDRHIVLRLEYLRTPADQANPPALQLMLSWEQAQRLADGLAAIARHPTRTPAGPSGRN